MISRRTLLKSTGGAALAVALPEWGEPQLWAVHNQAWVGMSREGRRSGCPRTAWLHEGSRPWRVLVSKDPLRLPQVHDLRPYTGGERILDWDVYLVRALGSRSV